MSKQNYGRSSRFNAERAQQENDQAYYYWFIKLKSLCKIRFEYENLPKTMNREYLEETLFYRAGACIFEDKDLSEINGEISLVNMPFTTSNLLNPYGYPTRITPYSSYCYAGYPEMSLEDSVICWCNDVRVPDYYTCEYYAKRLADLQRMHDVNLSHMKCAIVGYVDDQAEKDTIQQAYKKVNENELFLVVNRKGVLGTNLDNKKPLGIIGTDVQYHGREFLTSAQYLITEFLTSVGYESNLQDKKERMTQSEVTGNSGGTEGSRNVSLVTRQYAFDQVNEKWNQNVKVTFRSNINTMLNQAFKDFEIEESEELEIDNE